MATREGVSRQGRLVLAVLVVATLVSLWRAFAVEQEKRRIAANYEEAQQLVVQLTDEQQRLSLELSGAKKTVDSQAGDISTLRLELRGVQERLDQTVVELSSLQREHEQLRQEKSSLVSELSAMSSEKQELQRRLSSLKDLRLAIRDVKRKMSEERWAKWRAYVEESKQADREALARGNRGYVVHAGRSTIGSSPRLHVHVLEPEQQ
jgi:chromosome segregation ATPase